MLVRTWAAPTVSRGCLLIDQREVDELLQRLAQRLGRVVAGMVGAERDLRAEEGLWIDLEEPGNAGRQRPPRRERIGDAGPGRKQAPEIRALHAAPELLQPIEAVFAPVAGDDAGVDGADRGADDPIGLDARLVQRLIDAALIGAERAPALEHERALAVVLGADLVDGFAGRQGLDHGWFPRMVLLRLNARSSHHRPGSRSR